MKSKNQVRQHHVSKSKSKLPPLKGGWKHIEGNIQICGKYFEEYKLLAKTKGWGWSQFLRFALNLAAREMRKIQTEDRDMIKRKISERIFAGDQSFARFN